MTLCCTAKSASSPASIAKLTARGPLAAPSSVPGTPKLPMKQTAYRKVPRKIK
jgi:hypothetical protein